MSAPTVVRVVLLVGADGDTPQGAVLGSELTPLANLIADAGATVELDVISLGTNRVFVGATAHIRLDRVSPSRGEYLLRAVGAYWLRDRLDNFPVGRLLNSIGPVAPSRVFWRVIRRDAEALRVLKASQVVIAADLESTKGAWIAAHRGWTGNGFYDHRAVAVATQLPAR